MIYLRKKRHNGIIEELHILLSPDRELTKIIPSVPVLGFQKGTSLKDCLVRATLLTLDESRRCEPCWKKLVCSVTIQVLLRP